MVVVWLLAACGKGTTSPLAGAPTQLTFTTQPGDAQGNVVMPPIEVTIRDAAGNPAVASVTVGIGTNPWDRPGTRPGTLSGTLTVDAVGGLARFGDLRIDTPGSGYTLVATSGAARAQSAPFHVGLTFSSAATGVVHTCGLTGGGAYCWGDTFNGRLGAPTGSLDADPVPLLVAGGLSWTSIGAGANQACGVTTTHIAYCWGANDNGELGNGTTTRSFEPGPVSGGIAFTSISTGFGETCGLTTGNAVYCWGANNRGQLGNGTTTPSTMPVLVSGSGTTFVFTSVSTGGDAVCGVTPTHAVYCWGGDELGQLGNEATDSSATPVLVSGSGTSLLFASVSAGGEHACGVTTSHVAYCWGYNSFGQLGDATTTGPQLCGSAPTACSTAPVPVSGGLTFETVSAGGNFSCGVTIDNVAYCWGFNPNGQLGSGTTQGSATPVPVSGGLRFAAVSASFYACGVTTANAVYCWGPNDYGQLGDGTRVNPRLAPVRVID